MSSNWRNRPRPIEQSVEQVSRITGNNPGNRLKTRRWRLGARDVDLWSDQLVGLLGILELKSAYLAGPSLGSRISYITALRYPEVVRGLFLYLVSGGDGVAERLAQAYYGSLIDVAEKQ